MKCGQCDYEWTPRVEGKPKQCPRCKRYNYETKKEVKAAVQK